MDHENYRKHLHEGRCCPACKQKDCGPKHGVPSPSLPCPSCHRGFYNETCLQFHRTHICQSLIRCPLCCKELFTSDLKEPHHSRFTLGWLLWNEHQLPPSSSTPRIQHVRNGGEQRIAATPFAYRVDGLDHTTHNVYEFHGCLYHGCRRCFPDRDQYSFSSPDRTMEALDQATFQKTKTLRDMGYTVYEMWECEWQAKLRASPEIQSFLASLDIVPPLSSRDAFFGGRTGAALLYYKADETQGEEIRYVEVTSEYPWVNNYDTYPIGHPTILFEPEDQDPTHY